MCQVLEEERALAKQTSEGQAFQAGRSSRCVQGIVRKLVGLEQRATYHQAWRTVVKALTLMLEKWEAVLEL